MPFFAKVQYLRIHLHGGHLQSFVVWLSRASGYPGPAMTPSLCRLVKEPVLSLPKDDQITLK